MYIYIHVHRDIELLLDMVEVTDSPHSLCGHETEGKTKSGSHAPPLTLIIKVISVTVCMYTHVLYLCLYVL